MGGGGEDEGEEGVEANSQLRRPAVDCTCNSTGRMNLDLGPVLFTFPFSLIVITASCIHTASWYSIVHIIDSQNIFSSIGFRI